MVTIDIVDWFDSLTEWITNNSFRLALTILTVLLIWRLTGRTGRMMDSLYRTMSPHVMVKDPQRLFTERLLNWLFYTIALALVLFYWGVTPAFYATLIGLSITGLVIGLASRDILANLLAGLVLILEKPFAKGDRVESGGFAGTVVGLTMRSTLLETSDKKTVRIPNSHFMVQPLTNLSYNGHRQLTLDLTLARGTNVEQALARLWKLTDRLERKEGDERPDRLEVNVVGLDSGRAQVRITCRVPGDEAALMRTRLNIEILRVLAEAGIELG